MAQSLGKFMRERLNLSRAIGLIGTVFLAVSFAANASVAAEGKSAEAIVDSLFDHHSKEKACTFEPSKPCDHCSMCSSRGF